MKLRENPIKSAARFRRCRRKGAALFLVMTSLATLAILGGTFAMIATTDLKISKNYKNSIEAFQHADAGMKFVENELMRRFEANTLNLLGEVVPVTINPPAGFQFDPVTRITRTPDRKSYRYRVTGRSGNARVMIEATVQQTGGYPWSLFGEKYVDLKKNSNVFNGNVGSNGHINLAHNATIDGDATPGPWESVVGNVSGVSGSTSPAAETRALDPISPADLIYARSDNNNASIPPAILTGTSFVMGTSSTVTLASGTYYFTDMVVGNGAALNTSGEVIIYLDGNLDIKTGSTSNNTDADLLQIFTTTNKSINIRHGSAFHGHIYAPNASRIDLKADGGFYGSAICGGIISTKMGAFYYLEGTAPAGKSWGVTSWKLIRE